MKDQHLRYRIFLWVLKKKTAFQLFFLSDMSDISLLPHLEWNALTCFTLPGGKFLLMLSYEALNQFGLQSVPNRLNPCLVSSNLPKAVKCPTLHPNMPIFLLSSRWKTVYEKSTMSEFIVIKTEGGNTQMTYYFHRDSKEHIWCH